MTVEELIAAASRRRASDIHFAKGQPVALRVDGSIRKAPPEMALDNMDRQLENLLNSVQLERFQRGEDVDFALQTACGIRCRVNLFHRMGEVGCVMRLLPANIPSMEELGLPPLLEKIAMLPRGLVLVTGPTGSGKSTTLASVIDYANSQRESHIITVEDPVEYLHTPKRCLVSQREVGRDTPSFAAALRSALREDPDIIMVGEMRDFETISAALTAAETGHLVFSTLHTVGAVKSIDRILDVFPPHQQGQIRIQLAGVLQGVITQQLVRRPEGGRRVALEVMASTPAIANLIREGKTHQIESVMQTSAREGMQLLDWDLAQLVRRGEILREEALAHCSDPANLALYLA